MAAPPSSWSARHKPKTSPGVVPVLACRALTPRPHSPPRLVSSPLLSAHGLSAPPSLLVQQLRTPWPRSVRTPEVVILPRAPSRSVAFSLAMYKMENVGKDQEDALQDVAFTQQPVRVDLSRLTEMADSEKGASQMQYFVKHWEHKRANTSRLLSEELRLLSQQRTELEQKKQQISKEERQTIGSSHGQELEDDAECDTVSYWKRRALRSEEAHEASLQRERLLEENLEESIKNLQTHTPVDEFSGMFKRADFFLHLILQSAPIVIAHQDADLRYRFIFNHFPTLADEDVIGKTDEDILSGEGIDEMNNVKREVMAKGIPTKREFVFDTPLFGAKTFVAYIEPVFSKSGETIGVNYVAMDVTDQVKRREKMMDIRVREAITKAKETSRSLHITEETAQAKQMLATLSHEIRSPLSEVLSKAKILATTKLDQEQYQLLEVMSSSGNIALRLINDIRDLSKLESGVMELEAEIFGPREVIKHVLHTASSFMKKELTLEVCIRDDVPSEVIADVQKVQQILTNLIRFSNAMESTQEGKVGINLSVVENQQPGCEIPSHENSMEHHKGEVVWLRFDVYDTGIGIPEKSLPFLFKRYMHANADHATKDGGTGLGLAVCKQLVDLMGGTLTVVSQENEGSTFTVMLPCTIPVREAQPWPSQ